MALSQRNPNEFKELVGKLMGLMNKIYLGDEKLESAIKQIMDDYDRSIFYIKDEGGRNILHVFSIDDRFNKILRALLAVRNYKPITPDPIDQFDNTGNMTPLLSACGKVNVIKNIEALLEYGADPKLMNKQNMTAISLAQVTGRDKYIIDLLENKKNIKIKPNEKMASSTSTTTSVQNNYPIIFFLDQNSQIGGPIAIRCLEHLYPILKFIYPCNNIAVQQSLLVDTIDEEMHFRRNIALNVQTKAYKERNFAILTFLNKVTALPDTKLHFLSLQSSYFDNIFREIIPNPTTRKKIISYLKRETPLSELTIPETNLADEITNILQQPSIIEAMDLHTSNVINTVRDGDGLIGYAYQLGGKSLRNIKYRNICIFLISSEPKNTKTNDMGISKDVVINIDGKKLALPELIILTHILNNLIANNPKSDRIYKWNLMLKKVNEVIDALKKAKNEFDFPKLKELESYTEDLFEPKFTIPNLDADLLSQLGGKVLLNEPPGTIRIQSSKLTKDVREKLGIHRLKIKFSSESNERISYLKKDDTITIEEMNNNEYLITFPLNKSNLVKDVYEDESWSKIKVINQTTVSQPTKETETRETQEEIKSKAASENQETSTQTKSKTKQKKQARNTKLEATKSSISSAGNISDSSKLDVAFDPIKKLFSNGARISHNEQNYVIDLYFCFNASTNSYKSIDDLVEFSAEKIDDFIIKPLVSIIPNIQFDDATHQLIFPIENLDSSNIKITDIAENVLKKIENTKAIKRLEKRAKDLLSPIINYFETANIIINGKDLSIVIGVDNIYKLKKHSTLRELNRDEIDELISRIGRVFPSAFFDENNNAIKLQFVEPDSKDIDFLNNIPEKFEEFILKRRRKKRDLPNESQTNHTTLPPDEAKPVEIKKQKEPDYLLLFLRKLLNKTNIFNTKETEFKNGKYILKIPSSTAMALPGTTVNIEFPIIMDMLKAVLAELFYKNNDIYIYQNSNSNDNSYKFGIVAKPEFIQLIKDDDTDVESSLDMSLLTTIREKLINSLIAKPLTPSQISEGIHKIFSGSTIEGKIECTDSTITIPVSLPEDQLHYFSQAAQMNGVSFIIDNGNIIIDLSSTDITFDVLKSLFEPMHVPNTIDTNQNLPAPKLYTAPKYINTACKAPVLLLIELQYHLDKLSDIEKLPTKDIIYTANLFHNLNRIFIILDCLRLSPVISNWRAFSLHGQADGKPPLKSYHKFIECLKECGFYQIKDEKVSLATANHSLDIFLNSQLQTSSPLFSELEARYKNNRNTSLEVCVNNITNALATAQTLQKGNDNSELHKTAVLHYLCTAGTYLNELIVRFPQAWRNQENCRELAKIIQLRNRVCHEGSIRFNYPQDRLDQLCAIKFNSKLALDNLEHRGPMNS